MEPEQIYNHLEEIAQKLGISVRYENLSTTPYPTRSGLCRLRGRHVFIMDSSKKIHQRIEILASCLSEMDLEGVYVVPAVRSLLKIPSKSC